MAAVLYDTKALLNQYVEFNFKTTLETKVTILPANFEPDSNKV